MQQISIFENFLQKLQQSLSRHTKFKDWRDLEQLTANEALFLTQQYSEFQGWHVEYNSKGHRFPDIVIQSPEHRWGIEVKSSQAKNWQTLGGSIQESTKIQNLEQIFILLAKNSKQGMQIKIRDFESCVSSVAVTHSPRYLIDLDLPKGQDLFTQLNTSYAAVSELEQPFDIFKQYFQKKAEKSKTQFWFLSDLDQDRTSETFQKLELRFFNQLSTTEQRQLICEAIILYPEDIFAGKNSKYERANLFFLSRNVVSNSMRDNFSAGGKINYLDHTFPQKLSLLLDAENQTVLSYLLNTDATLEMQRLYATQDNQQIKAQWNKRITDALHAHLLVGLPEDIRQAIIHNVQVQ